MYMKLPPTTLFKKRSNITLVSNLLKVNKKGPKWEKI